MKKVGITERGDIHFHEEWISKVRNGLVDAAILISKDMPTPRGREEMLSYPEKYMFHCTITGLGGTHHEPFVRNMNLVLRDLDNFCEEGFPKDHVVVRVDPILPNLMGFHRARSVITAAFKLGFRSFRYSFMDVYGHVAQCYKDLGKEVPVSIKEAHPALLKNFDDFLRKMEEKGCSFASCAENNRHQRACVGQTEYSLLRLGEAPKFRKGQRGACLCCAGKTELLEHLGQCPHRCTYCYWRHTVTEEVRAKVATLRE